MDTLSKPARSKNMAAIKSLNTIPEIKVRKLLYSMGYRYRIHKKGLIGKPDVYIKKGNIVIFINGCFWHQHKNCKRKSMPKTNIEYWGPKLQGNINRFAIQKEELRKKGYNVVVIWECQIKKTEDLRSLLLLQFSNIK